MTTASSSVHSLTTMKTGSSSSGFMVSSRLPSEASPSVMMTTQALCPLLCSSGAMSCTFLITSLIWRQSGVSPLGPLEKNLLSFSLFSSSSSSSVPTSSGGALFRVRISDGAEAARDSATWNFMDSDSSAQREHFATL